jgi:hypothetical protein
VVGTPWRPGSEAEAASTMATFVEWLRANRTVPDADPTFVRQWLRRRPGPGLDAVARFAGLRPELGWGWNLRRHTGDREAVVRVEPSGERRRWSFDAIRLDETLWREAARQHACGSYQTLLRVTADHLLFAETRPADTLTWHGDPDDPWPWGALSVGARLVLGAQGQPVRAGRRDELLASSCAFRRSISARCADAWASTPPVPRRLPSSSA